MTPHFDHLTFHLIICAIICTPMVVEALNCFTSNSIVHNVRCVIPDIVYNVYCTYETIILTGFMCHKNLIQNRTLHFHSIFLRDCYFQEYEMRQTIIASLLTATTKTRLFDNEFARNFRFFLVFWCFDLRGFPATV